MKPTHICLLCNKKIKITGLDPNMDNLAHLSAVHGIVVPAVKSKRKSREAQVADARVTAYLESIQWSQASEK
jgi:hypothetical protein